MLLLVHIAYVVIGQCAALPCAILILGLAKASLRLAEEL